MSESHRKKRRSINEIGHAHFLTFSCWKRMPLLSKDRSCQWVIDTIHLARKKLKLSIWAYVIMPEHVHLLLMPQSTDYEMSKILAALKRPVSRMAKAYLEENQNDNWVKKLSAHHGERKVFRFWQPGGGYDSNLWKTKTIEQVIDYIHANPVRRGLVERPTDWKWSSAGEFAGQPNGPLSIDEIEID